MIDINLTLLVQAINFFIAYYLLKKFFLEPALILIKADEEKADNVKSELNLEIIILNQKKDLKNKKLEEYKESYKHDLATLYDIKHTKEHLNLNISNDIKLKKDEILIIVKNISSELEKKVM